MREPGRTNEPRREGLGASMSKGMSQASEGLSTAFGFVFFVVVFWLGGRGLDGWLGTDPLFQIAGAIVGWVLGVLAVIYATQYRKKSRESGAKSQ